jgi:hypothetical protein
VTAPIPADPALPQLATMLDPEAMQDTLATLLGPGRALDDVRIAYVRYRPGARVLVRYAVTEAAETHEAVALADARSDLAARVASPENHALCHRAAGRVPARTPLSYVEPLQALVQWPPLDVALPVLAEPAELLLADLVRQGVRPADEADLPRLVKYKPLSRAVLRLDGYVLKAHPRDSSLERSALALRAVERLGLRTASLVATVPRWRVEVQSLVPGERPASAAGAAGAAGAVLAELHAADLVELPTTLPADRLAETVDAADLVATIAPALAPRAHALAARLSDALPDEPLVTSHGGFHVSQLLVDEHGEVGVIDLDGACRAPAAGDVASFGVSLVRGPGDLDAAFDALSTLCGAYGSYPRGVPWYLSALLLRRARLPFTRFRPGWVDELDTRLAAAEQALDVSW